MRPTTMERPLAVQSEQLGVVARLRNRVSTLLAIVATLLVVPAGAASAETVSTDLTGGSGGTFFSAITSYFQDHVIAAVLALLALTVGVSLLMGWGKKAAKSK
jgi:hypothetical protein